MKEIKDRAYWEQKASKETVELVEKIFEGLGEITRGYSLRYQTESYIAIEIDSRAIGFISFRPLKNEFVWIAFQLEKTKQIDKIIKVSGIENSYEGSQYELKIKELNIELIITLAYIAKVEYYNK